MEPYDDAELHARRIHPDWEYMTTYGPRKAWETENEPPPDGGWVRNVEAGDRGWARLSEHEEAYWRRRVSGREQA